MCVGTLTCRVIAMYDKTNSKVTLTYDKDMMKGTRFAYKVDGTLLYLYMYFTSGGARLVNGYLRSIEVSNSTASFSNDNAFVDYIRTINCWEIPSNERFLAEQPADATKIMNADIKVNSFAPVLTSPNGTTYKLVVNDDGTLSTETYNRGWADIYNS